jgi:uncharacterized membrane protein
VDLKRFWRNTKALKILQLTITRFFVNNSKPEYWGTCFYISVVLLLPIILMIFEITNKSRPYFSLIILIAFLFIFGRDLYKMVSSNVSLQINLKDNSLNVENNNGIFKRFYKKQTISFAEISKVEIFNKAVHSKYSATRWKEVTMFNKSEQKIILASFDEKYPDSL